MFLQKNSKQLAAGLQLCYCNIYGFVLLMKNTV